MFDDDEDTQPEFIGYRIRCVSCWVHLQGETDMQIDGNEVGVIMETISKCCALQAQTHERCCASITRVLWVLVIAFALVLIRLAFVIRW